MQALEHRIPPPVVVALTAGAMWLLSRAFAPLPIEVAIRLPIAVALAVLGLLVAASGAIAFRRAKTTVNPLKPEAASSLVIVGVYRVTRNPMYVGFASVLVGWAVYLGVPAALLGPIVFVLFITRFQIIPEERSLLSKFGPAFSEYQSKVRRWL